MADTTDAGGSTTGAPLDATPPELEIESPRDGARVSALVWTVSGSARDERGDVVLVEYRVDGGPAVAVPIDEGSPVDWTARVRLGRGWNEIEVTAEDAAGNRASEVIAVGLGSPLAAGGAHSLAHVEDEQTVWGWGRNNEGQLGVATDADEQPVPVVVLGPADAPSPVVSLSANLNHSVTLSASGEVWTWGRNDEGQLGTGAGPDRGVPGRVEGLTDVALIAAGQRHTLALRSDGTLWAWGSNISGQLGAEPPAPGLPVEVPGLPPAIAIAAGAAYSLVAAEDGTVWAWGRNTDGQLGAGEGMDQAEPQLVPGVVADVVAAGRAHGLTVRGAEAPWGWGLNFSGQIGVGSPEELVLEPTMLMDPLAVLTIRASGNNSVAIDREGQLWAWGDNFSGQLGTGDLDDRTRPEAIAAPVDARAVSPGLGHTLALDAEGRVWSWGLNTFGQLGDGVAGIEFNRASPFEVELGG